MWTFGLDLIVYEMLTSQNVKSSRVCLWKSLADSAHLNTLPRNLAGIFAPSRLEGSV